MSQPIKSEQNIDQMNRFQKALHRKNFGRPPVWFMRQAGRYHSHYQSLRKKHSFIELCKTPRLAEEVTFGPLDDFDFDAAILFSDILFPLEVLGMGLEYNPGPKLGWHLQKTSQLEQLHQGDPSEMAHKLSFQAEALQRIRTRIRSDKGLIGFVGAPLTLYTYAVEGSHKGDLQDARAGLQDGRFEGFMEKLVPLLVENILLQAEAQPDAIALFDTCAGDYSNDDHEHVIRPWLQKVFQEVKQKEPNLPLIYYSKNTGPIYWESLRHFPLECIGIDWHHSLKTVCEKLGDQFAIQGNFNPNWMLEPKAELEPKIHAFFEEALLMPEEQRRGWICGLGHGVLPKVPEENVRLFLSIQKEKFSH